MNGFSAPRNSSMEFDKIYFWTATIHKWDKMLLPAAFKETITDSLTHLSELKTIDVFGFVIMPNHLHMIWRMNDMNGKETPRASLLKDTAHQFKSMLEPNELPRFKVTAANKKCEFWQRDALAIELYTPEVAYQKLDYIHLNPLAEHWNLVKPEICNRNSIPIQNNCESVTSFELCP
ncbi:MAG: transposase [Cytophagales bacterium]|nr:transposase [Cytophagales bacterium]